MKKTRFKTAILLAGAALCVAGAASAQTRMSAQKEEPARAAIARPVQMKAVKQDQTLAAAVRSDETKAALAANVRNLSVSPAMIEAHEMKPANVVGAVSDNGLDDKDAAAPTRALIQKAGRSLQGASAAAIKGEIQKMPQTKAEIGSITARTARVNPGIAGAATELAAPPTPYLDVAAFGQAFHAAIKDDVAGYALRIGKNGQTIYTLQWNWAQTPNDSSLGWNPQRRMHIASVSKLMTGIAMTRLLHEKGISPNAKIISYLPSYWQKGSNINDITFSQLLKHTSGFSTGSSSSDYEFMKSRVAAGVPSTGSYDYENMNFGLCRILIAVINGNIDKNANFGMFNDLIWDAITVNAYAQYMEDKVFAPSGVSGPSLSKPSSPARAYPFPVAGDGWNSGNLASMAGGAGWHMSINEILAVMHTFRRTNKIVPPSVAQDALEDGFGIDRRLKTKAGTIYEKNGLWRDGSQRTEQSVATFLPEGMDVVVFTNSPIGSEAASLRNLVKDLYIANIIEP